MPTINPWVILGLLATYIGAIAGGYIWGDSSRNTAWLAKTETEKRVAIQHALDEERFKQGKINDIVKKQTADHAAISHRLRADLARLRDRPERPSGMSESSGSSCAGATGSELSRPDGEFLSWEAARADEIRAGLMACYAVMDEIKQ